MFSYLLLGHYSGRFPTGSSAKILYAFFVAPSQSHYRPILHFPILTIPGEDL